MKRENSCKRKGLLGSERSELLQGKEQPIDGGREQRKVKH